MEGLNISEGIEPVTGQIDRENFDDDSGKRNPLTTDLVGDVLKDKKERKAERWFADVRQSFPIFCILYCY